MAPQIEESALRYDRSTLVSQAPALMEYLAQALQSQSVLPEREARTTPDLALARQAAVLVPLYADGDLPRLLFTRRSANLAAHRGEISFPGGSRDPGDPSLIATALREAHEEIGLDLTQTRVLGQLPPEFAAVSNFIITPVIGWLGSAPLALDPTPSEVAEVIDAPLAALVDPVIYHAETWVRGGEPHLIHFYDFGPHRIWGVTGRILHQVLALLPD
jgi:8-oxo-dGTP pyrophosphatase MutT (NUDIX family)